MVNGNAPTSARKKLSAGRASGGEAGACSSDTRTQPATRNNMMANAAMSLYFFSGAHCWIRVRTTKEVILEMLITLIQFERRPAAGNVK